ncbi:MAG: M28 family peptidase [Bacteroidota bacterium]
MKRSTFLILILIAISKISISQDLEYTKRVVSKLASPEFKGRGYVEDGDKLAANYIIEEFKAVGIKPISKTYNQKFNVSVNTFPNSPILKINNEELKIGVDYLIESSSPSIDGTFKIIVINRKDIANQDNLLNKIAEAKNNLLLVDTREKTGEDKELTKKIDNLIDAIKYDPQVSVKGVVVLTKDKLTWECSSTLNSKPIIIINKEIDINKVSSIQIKIEGEFKKKYETQNIVGIIEGEIKPDSFIVVTAHYDHLGMLGKEVYFPGANDNASGVALLLNLGKYYSQHKPKYSIVFIALAAEELGILGAKEFTDNPMIKLNKIKFLINFDLAGTGDEGIRVVNGSVFKDKFDLMTKINTENQLLPKIDIRGEACISDHCLFYQKGVPCFYIYTQGGIKAYHDIYDKYETLPFTEFDDYVKLVIKFFDAI